MEFHSLAQSSLTFAVCMAPILLMVGLPPILIPGDHQCKLLEMWDHWLILTIRWLNFINIDLISYLQRVHHLLNACVYSTMDACVYPNCGWLFERIKGGPSIKNWEKKKKPSKAIKIRMIPSQWSYCKGLYVPFKVKTFWPVWQFSGDKKRIGVLTKKCKFQNPPYQYFVLLKLCKFSLTVYA